MPHSSNKKRHYTPRNQPTPVNAEQQDLGHYDARPNSRFDFGPHGPPPFWSYQARPGRPVGNFNGQPPRSFDAAPVALPYEVPGSGPEAFNPPMPYITDRAFGGQFRRSTDHGFPEYQNRLFLEGYRFSSSHQQIYQAPRFEAGVHHESDLRWREEHPCELEGKPLLQCIKLRGDAPEFIPGQKCAVDEEPKEKTKEPCWLVVSSH
ncbi:hypothetical protein BDW59DRAFT_163748 [Aspergillus cavernicola]|uniref:Uncharacterized protein n=1 Tax=Aspergillus cavernicola TaxID=176166 RepID=A0ABR4I4V8_9EURO